MTEIYLRFLRSGPLNYVTEQVLQYERHTIHREESATDGGAVGDGRAKQQRELPHKPLISLGRAIIHDVI
jgi:hypothetical protein